jgi:hypothetical protein
LLGEGEMMGRRGGEEKKERKERGGGDKRREGITDILRVLEHAREDFPREAASHHETRCLSLLATRYAEEGPQDVLCADLGVVPAGHAYKGRFAMVVKTTTRKRELGGGENLRCASCVAYSKTRRRFAV